MDGTRVGQCPDETVPRQERAQGNRPWLRKPLRSDARRHLFGGVDSACTPHRTLLALRPCCSRQGSIVTLLAHALRMFPGRKTRCLVPSAPRRRPSGMPPFSRRTDTLQGARIGSAFLCEGAGTTRDNVVTPSFVRSIGDVSLLRASRKIRPPVDRSFAARAPRLSLLVGHTGRTPQRHRHVPRRSMELHGTRYSEPAGPPPTCRRGELSRNVCASTCRKTLIHRRSSLRVVFRTSSPSFLCLHRTTTH